MKSLARDSTMFSIVNFASFLLLLTLVSSESDTQLQDEGPGSNGVFQFEGKILPPDNKPSDWHWSTRILIDGGRRVAFLKVSFQIASWEFLLVTDQEINPGQTWADSVQNP